MIVLPYTGALRYHNCCIDGGTSPECFGYNFVFLISHSCEHIQRKLDDIWEESKKVGLVINSSKTEEIRVNAIVNKDLGLNGMDIKRSSDLYYIGYVVSEDSGARMDVKVRI
jgi:hypothetical protein